MTECCCEKNCCKMELQLPPKKNFKHTYPKCTPCGYSGVGNTSGLYINKTVKLDNLMAGSKIIQKNRVNGINPNKAPLINNPTNLNKKIDLTGCCDYQCICPQFLSDEEINELYLQALNSDIYWSTSYNINNRNKKINKVKYCLDQCSNKIEECKCCEVGYAGLPLYNKPCCCCFIQKGFGGGPMCNYAVTKGNRISKTLESASQMVNNKANNSIYVVNKTAVPKKSETFGTIGEVAGKAAPATPSVYKGESADRAVSCCCPCETTTGKIYKIKPKNGLLPTRSLLSRNLLYSLQIDKTRNPLFSSNSGNLVNFKL